MTRTLLLTFAALALTDCGGNPTPPPTTPTPVPLTNRQQTERLIGTWAVTVVIDKPYMVTYKLRDLVPSTAVQGEYYLNGVNDSGGQVLAGYSSALNGFDLYDPGSQVDLFYTFDFTGADTVSGCLYFVQAAGNMVQFSQCFAMTGSRTSLSAAAVATPGAQALRFDSSLFRSSSVPERVRQQFARISTLR